ncbi:hypothetical protein Noc_0307 [Nitrosococcus oceani ATCC 19707]|uniref:Uncharacterized protein n=1 Tax=Nitrosococcus oceani (strain ATCC 19707 / BCRC 17464 / JCM 30415 / NCIMB 11848 / C-107) TaxID=323261 RepID=Q3JEB1_NITOC|nr:hypothetical protein [Nitrosococcus oceani]ABA56835.1 hypothetical protein Noc_0307 [Nitrosococcus oceani ATCC 19707]
MTDVDFVPTKPHQPGEFSLQGVFWAGHDLARKALGWVSPSTRIISPPTEGRSRSWQQGKYTANCWRNASHAGPRARSKVSLRLSACGHARAGTLTGGSFNIHV